MLETPWKVQLLGGLRATQANHVIDRFYTHKIGGLFAYLAYHSHRAHPREELIERFWPDADLESGRMSLRTALASLRRQLEPPGVTPGAALIADRYFARLNPDSITTDVAAFEREIQAAKADTAEQIARLKRAVALYQGELLPGYYDDWVLTARTHLAETHLWALRQLAAALGAQGDHEAAIGYARQAVQESPLEEEAHYDLMRLYAAAGRTAAALQQYQELERNLRAELDTTPERSAEEALRDMPKAQRPAAEAPETPAHDRNALRVEPPAPVVASAPPHEAARVPPLPAPLTPFFGREEEIGQIRALLEMPGARLITLTGLGGTGKTRLALEVASRLRTEGRRVYFVALADTSDPRLIGETIRAALQLPASASGDALAQIVEALADEPALLALDNYEQLLTEGGPNIVARLLERLPELTCLVTSRLPLGLKGEWEFPVAPLPTPATPATPERLLEFAGVRLFVSRAQAARPDFQITAANAQAVAQLCHSLEGIPLALELAAARAQVLTPAQMVQHVARRFDFLVGRHRDAEHRHRALRAVLDWSYQALTDSHRRLLAQLSVFRGGWSLEAAETVCQAPDVLDLLMDLRESTLILAAEQGEEMRFRMLETVREYTQERLQECGEREAARIRHRDYFLALAERARIQRIGPEQTRWLERLEVEHDNLRAALDTCRERPDGGEPGLRLVSLLDWFWDLRGHFVEGRERYRAALAHPGAQAPTQARAAALNAAGNFAEMQSDFAAARRLQEEGLEIARAVGDKVSIATALGGLGSLARNIGDYPAARRFFEESLAAWEETGDRSGINSAKVHLALVARDQGDYETARALLTERLAIAREDGNRQSTAVTLSNLGLTVCAQGDFATARACFEESLALHREQQNPWGICAALHNLGMVRRLQEDYPAARALFEESLSIVRALGDKQGVAGTLDHLGLIAGAQGKIEEARGLFTESLALRRELKDRHGLIGTLAAVAQFAAECAEPECAAILWGVTERLRAEHGAQVWPCQQDVTARHIASVRCRLGDTAFDAAWAEGRAMAWEQALEFALNCMTRP